MDREAILTSFDFINVKPSEGVVTKSLEICVKYGLEAEDFVDQWSAYTISHLNGKEPTVEYLVQMERKELAKAKDTPASAKKLPATPKNVKVYGDLYPFIWAFERVASAGAIGQLVRSNLQVGQFLETRPLYWPVRGTPRADWRLSAT